MYLFMYGRVVKRILGNLGVYIKYSYIMLIRRRYKVKKKILG